MLNIPAAPTLSAQQAQRGSSSGMLTGSRAPWADPFSLAHPDYCTQHSREQGPALQLPAQQRFLPSGKILSTGDSTWSHLQQQQWCLPAEGDAGLLQREMQDAGFLQREMQDSCRRCRFPAEGNSGFLLREIQDSYRGKFRIPAEGNSGFLQKEIHDSCSFPLLLIGSIISRELLKPHLATAPASRVPVLHSPLILFAPDLIKFNIRFG